jgi:transposase
VVAVYEAGWSGFWLARWLAKHGIETNVIQPSSFPVDRRARRAKSEGIDAELLLRTLLALLRGEPRVCPTHARAKIARMLDRLELLLIQITELEQSRDAVLEDQSPDRASSMIQQLAKLRGIGVQSATVLVREGFVRKFANGKAIGSYAGLTATPYSSGGVEREQGMGKAGNARLRTVMVELAWLWQRYQPGSAQVSWFRERVSRRMRKVMVVALAPKLFIALWRFATQGVVPEGAARILIPECGTVVRTQSRRM